MKKYLPLATGAPRSFAHSRLVYFVNDLAQLRGPRTGTVTLPKHLDWTPSATYDLNDPVRIQSMYAVVLREAGSETDLRNWLNPDLLLTHWQHLNISDFIRQCWEHENPTLKNPQDRV